MIKAARDADGLVFTLNSSTLYKSPEFWATLGAVTPMQNSTMILLCVATSARRGVEAATSNVGRKMCCLWTGVMLSSLLIGLVCLIAMCCTPNHIWQKDFVAEYEDISTASIMEGEEVA
jgi:hypothetical protein